MNQEIKDTIDNGESEVQLTTIGKVIGTGANGEPVEQNLTEESLKKLAETRKKISERTKIGMAKYFE